MAGPAAAPRRRRSCRRAWHGRADLSPWPSATAATWTDADQVLAPIRALGDPVVRPARRAALHPGAVLPRRHRAQGRPLLLEDRIPRRADDDLLSTAARAVRRMPHPGRASWASSISAAPSTSATTTTGPSGTGTPASSSASRHVGAGRARRRRVPAVGPRRRGAAAALLDRRAPTSTSRPPTRARSASGRPTAPTSTAWSRSSSATTRTTCSAPTATSLPAPHRPAFHLPHLPARHNGCGLAARSTLDPKSSEESNAPGVLSLAQRGAGGGRGWCWTWPS